MKMLEKVYAVYPYEELSESAKEKVRNDYLEYSRDAEDFEESCLDYLREKFPNSDLNVQFCLSYCQGDGLNIYGKLFLHDILEDVEKDFSESERELVQFVLDGYGAYGDMQVNRHYSYFCENSYTEKQLDDLYYDYCNELLPEDFDMNGAEQILEKLDSCIHTYMKDIAGKLEKEGYDYFYEVSDEELSDWSMENDLAFYADGKIVDELYSEIESKEFAGAEYAEVGIA